MPHIIVKVVAGKSEQQKVRLTETINDPDLATTYEVGGKGYSDYLSVSRLI